MFGILLSALNSALAWVFRSVLVKFFLFFGLYFVTSEFVGFVADLIPNASSVNGALSGIGSATWYFLDTFQVTTGVSALMSAYATRFIIRRMPVIG